jgi:hypothetical protein
MHGFGIPRGGLAAVAAAALIGLIWTTPGHAAGEGASAAAPEESREPMRLVVSLSGQRVDVYRGQALLESSRVSSGKQGYSTPAGVYSILQKAKWHRSNIYSGAPMPFMQRITWSGIALHSSNQVPVNQPASHGCIRLPDAFARSLFGQTEIGVDVIVTKGEGRPEAIEHPVLFQPTGPRLLTAARGRTRSLAGEGELAAQYALADLEADVDRLLAHERRSTSPLRILATRRTGRERMMDVQRMLAELGHDPGEIDGYLGSDTGGAIQSYQRAQGRQATGMFTEQLVADLYRAVGRPEITGHLYVRQDYVDLFDLPVPLAGGDAPLGTHVYMAGHFEEGATQVQWSALTIGGAEGSSTPAGALSRFALPADTAQRIAELLTPGSTLIVSDEGRGRETGKGTDFIVQVR